jgi:hypothetical protein
LPIFSLDLISEIRYIFSISRVPNDRKFVSEKITDFEAAEIMLHKHLKKHHFIGELSDISFEEAVEAYQQVINGRLDVK